MLPLENVSDSAELSDSDAEINPFFESGPTTCTDTETGKNRIKQAWVLLLLTRHVRACSARFKCIQNDRKV